MPTYAKVIAARFAFLLCGAVAVRMSAICRSLRTLFPDASGQWLTLSIALLTVGGVSLIAAIIPLKWIVKMRGADLDNEFQRKLPIRMLLGSAAFSYLSIVGLTLAGPALSLPPGIVYALCPACALTTTVDPSLSSVLLILAPVNAAVYGAIGATIAFALVAIRRPNS
jgi:hypothetical protein